MRFIPLENPDKCGVAGADCDVQLAPDGGADVSPIRGLVDCISATPAIESSKLEFDSSLNFILKKPKKGVSID